MNLYPCIWSKLRLSAHMLPLFAYVLLLTVHCSLLISSWDSFFPRMIKLFWACSFMFLQTRVFLASVIGAHLTTRHSNIDVRLRQIIELGKSTLVHHYFHLEDIMFHPIFSIWHVPPLSHLHGKELRKQEETNTRMNSKIIVNNVSIFSDSVAMNSICNE